MLMTQEAPTSVELETEELRRRNTAFEVLAGFKVDVAHVYRSWVGPDSDLVMFVGGVQMPPTMTVLYLDSHRRPRTALVSPEGHVQVRLGWKGYDEV